jgi:hypothetical protein
VGAKKKTLKFTFPIANQELQQPIIEIVLVNSSGDCVEQG